MPKNINFHNSVFNAESISTAPRRHKPFKSY